jgi:uncharacterized FAD-dependent dehydrogenase
MINRIELELTPEQIADSANICKTLAASALKVGVEQIKTIDYVKRSLDARSKTPKYKVMLDVYIDEEKNPTPSYISTLQHADPNKRIIIVGAGPAGYFAALQALELGMKPIVLERGKDVRVRRFDLKSVMTNGEVNTNSNYCFGEGGAGTYSDGKLYTRSNKRGDINKILKIFVEHGADENIMYEARPHIGSDKLPKIIGEIRQTIIDFGGEVHFDSFVDDIIIKSGKAVGVIVNYKEEYLGDAIIWAIGHSANDTYYMMRDKGVELESKGFAIGFRAEHYQEQINEIQYGKKYSKLLPAAEYKVVAQYADRGVFSFCMCPGGIIVPASTGANELVVNGMSMSQRNSKFANSGLVCSVDAQDFIEFESQGVMAGLKFREALEAKFYTPSATNLQAAPAQRLIDFINKKRSTSLNETSYHPGLENRNLNQLLPNKIASALRGGFKVFGEKVRGFISEDAMLIGMESRTSSPLRTTRDKESFESVNVKRLFPCGEGAGYAGGIVSSALDGQNATCAAFRLLY